MMVRFAIQADEKSLSKRWRAMHSLLIEWQKMKRKDWHLKQL